MISTVSQIEKEFLLKNLVETEQPIRFHGASDSAFGLIASIDRDGLTLKLQTPENQVFSPFERVTGYFDCRGHTYAFETTIRSIEADAIRLAPPAKLLRSLQRKYVRVKKPRGLSVSMHLANEEVRMDYPECPEYLSVDDKQKAKGGDQLQDLIKSFYASLSAKCNAKSIIMFRTKKPDSLEENLIYKTGKILFIPSTGADLPKVDPYPDGRIITADMAEEDEDPNHFVEGTRLARQMAEKRVAGISSEIWCPIIYYQYVIGYIYLNHTGLESFDIGMVEYLWDFSRILANALKQSGYFDGETKKGERTDHLPTLIDISPGGMLISLTNEQFRTPLKEGSLFCTEIKQGANVVKCLARVARRYDRADSVSYGTTFINLSSEDIMRLYEWLYRRPFNPNDPIAHEQVPPASQNSFLSKAK